MTRSQLDPTNTAHVAATWSIIAEPGDTWAGHLRQALGNEEALRWALSPYTALNHIAGPNQAHPRGWRAAWQRWNTHEQTPNTHHQLEILAALDGRLITPDMDEWPTQLNDLGHAAPPALWVLGKSPINTDPRRAVTITGARAATAYGVRVTHTLATDLTAQGVTIITGGAYGIEAAAHKAALSNDPTPTTAILCGGLQHLYPAGNHHIFEEILDQGGNLICEVPPTHRPARWRFLERNRLLAAWSGLTIIPEANPRSGSIATATQANKLQRPVAAIPGPVTSPAANGPNELIRTSQAHLITNAEQALDLLN